MPNFKNARKSKPTKEEKKLAIELQEPKALPPAQGIQQMTDNPSAITLGSIGAAGLSESAAPWIKAEELIETGQEGFSMPFLIIAAFAYESKDAGMGSRVGYTIRFNNGDEHSVGLPRYQKDGTPHEQREAILKHFEDSTVPIGPVCLRGIDVGQPNPYLEFVSQEYAIRSTKPF